MERSKKVLVVSIVFFPKSSAGRIEQMVFVKEYRIEYGTDDITGESWFLPSDPLYCAPFDISLNMRRYLKSAVFGECSINFKEPLLNGLNPVICADVNEFLHQF